MLFSTYHLSAIYVFGNKWHFFVFIIWYIQKKVVILHREPAPGMSVHHQRRVADILKRRLLRSVLTIRNLANFSCVQDLATIDVLRDLKLSLLCQLWYVFCVYTYAHTRTLTTNIAREYILYSAWASRCRSNTMGNARASNRGTTTVGLHAFFICLLPNLLAA